ncbi:MAG: hypothetical protein ACOVP4_06315 [Bacteriovoracaceae bacterium]
MKLVTGILMVSALTLVGCSSAKKADMSEEQVAKSEKEIKTEAPDYVIMEASQPTRPAWILDPMLGDEVKERKKSRYFVNESKNVNQRLCVRSAEARATSQISREIAQFMKNSYTEATQNEGDEATEYMEEQLAQESQTFLVGTKSLKTFWEKRRYKEELGAEEDKTEYTCYALVKMTKKDVEEAVKRSRRKLLDNLGDPEVKKKAEKALDGAEKAFANLEKPVQLEASEDEE